LEAEIGHEIDALTEAEGLRPVHWFEKNCADGRPAAALQRLGDELAQAAETEAITRAREVVQERGHKLNSRVSEARRAGAKI